MYEIQLQLQLEWEEVFGGEHVNQQIVVLIHHVMLIIVDGLGDEVEVLLNVKMTDHGHVNHLTHQYHIHVLLYKVCHK